MGGVRAPGQAPDGRRRGLRIRLLSPGLGACVLGLAACKAPNPALEQLSGDDALDCVLKVKVDPYAAGLDIGLDEEAFAREIERNLEEFGVATHVGSAPDSDPPPVVEVEIGFLEDTSISEDGEVTGRAWLTGLFWFGAWIPGLFVEDTSYSTRLRMTCRIAPRSKGEARPLRVDHPITLSFTERVPTLSWRMALSPVVPPFLLGDDPEELKTSQWKRAAQNIAAAVAEEVRDWAPDSTILGELPAFSGKRYALLVGVGEYRSSRLESVPNAAQDVSSIAAFLEESGEWEDIVCLKNSEATRNRLTKELRDLGGRGDESDLVMFYFAGHGLQTSDARRDQLLLPYDYQAENPASAINQDDLPIGLEWTGSSPRRQLVVLDCCHAGIVTGLRGLSSPAWSSIAATGRAVLTSTSRDEKAVDGVGEVGSPFASEFLNALKSASADRNGDGLTVDELHDALFEPVRRAARAQNGVMTPQLLGAEWASEIQLRSPR